MLPKPQTTMRNIINILNNFKQNAKVENQDKQSLSDLRR